MDKIPCRVVFLCGDGESTRFVINGLSQSSTVLKVVIEDKPSSIGMIKWRIRRLGFLAVLGQLSFLFFNRMVMLGQKKRIETLKQQLQLDASPIPKDLTMRVASVNDKKVAAIVAELKPDLVIVNGTRIISAEILSSITCPVINTHVGITPMYRGVHGGYWAMAKNDPDNYGVTVHLVDDGVDTGGVVYQARIRPCSTDTFNTYPLHQYHAEIPLLRQVIDDVSNGSLKAVSAAGQSKQWFHPTLAQYVANWIRNDIR